MFTPADTKYGLLNLQFFDEVGNGTGNINMNVNGSVTPREFKLRVPAGYRFHLNTVAVVLQAASAMAIGDYGGIPALTNGTKLFIRRPGKVDVDVTSQLPIRTNSDWMSYTFKAENFDFVGGARLLSLSYNLISAGRSLALGAGAEYVVQINDDLTLMPRHLFRCSFTAVPVT